MWQAEEKVMTTPAPISEELFASLAHELERTGRVIIGAQLLGKLEAWYRLARRMEAALRAQEEAFLASLLGEGGPIGSIDRIRKLKKDTSERAVELRRAIIAELDQQGIPK